MKKNDNTLKAYNIEIEEMIQTKRADLPAIEKNSCYLKKRRRARHNGKRAKQSRAQRIKENLARAIIKAGLK
ncbi:MAG: hypothetical protein ACLRSG_07690 [Christensenellales bacterium]